MPPSASCPCSIIASPTQPTGYKIMKKHFIEHEEGLFNTNVAGEYFHRENLIKLCGEKRQVTINALLILDDNNPHDKNAVRVEINNLPVGYLSKEMAVTYRQYINKINKSESAISCRARIKRNDRVDTQKTYYDVYLSLPEKLSDSPMMTHIVETIVAKPVIKKKKSGCGLIASIPFIVTVLYILIN